MMGSGDACCPPDAPGQQAADELEDDDPTLADCCRREAEANRRSAALRQRLAAVDVSTTHARLGGGGILGEAPPLGADTDEEDDELRLTSDEDEEGEGGDPELARLRAERIKAMQASAARKTALLGSGRGQLVDVEEGKLQATLDRQGGFAAVHLCFAGVQVCDAMDEALEALAGAHLGTAFLRVPIKGRSSRVAGAWGVRSLPALVCLRDGLIVGKAAVPDFGSTEEIHEEKVAEWLSRLRVLRDAGGAAQRSLAAEESDGEEEEGGGEGAPCAECGRCYPHEHIRAVYGRAESDSGSDSD
mmetsp:Transcript_32341/g.81595  ORF Transcript_32341/g.81595 Transcript_32341/m.81595 type:complete len:302 (-) Transcript_32341:477-1382(-)